MQVVHEVCCGLDAHKKSVTACVGFWPAATDASWSFRMRLKNGRASTRVAILSVTLRPKALGEVGEIRHKTPIGAWDGGFAPGLDPARGDDASFANFSDPDGNGLGATGTECVT